MQATWIYVYYDELGQNDTNGYRALVLQKIILSFVKMIESELDGNLICTIIQDTQRQ